MANEKKAGTLNPNLLSTELSDTMNRAADIMATSDRRLMTPEVVLLAMLRSQETTAYRMLQGFSGSRGLKLDELTAEVERAASDRLDRDANFGFVTDDNRRVPLSEEMLKVLDEGLTASKARDETRIGTQHFLAAMAREGVVTGRLLQKYGITERAIQDKISEISAARTSAARDYVALALQGETLPVYFREELLGELMNALSTVSPRHVIIVGPDGVGKWTLAYSMALLIAEKKGPPNLKSLVAIEEQALFDNALLAVRGGLRMARGGALLVPDIGRFFGGFRAELPENAGKELQKAFFDDRVAIIGTSTEEMYEERLSKSSAVQGRAQVMRMSPASVDETAQILGALKGRLEADYGLSLKEDSFAAAAKLASRYFTQTPLPGGAVQLLHRTCANVRMGMMAGTTGRASEPDREVDGDDVLVTVNLLTGIPVDRLGADEKARYAHMVEHLHTRIIGQHEAVMAVSRAIKTARVGLKDPRRPIGSFFFLGPTGVGKTELGKALAEFMFGTEDDIIAIDMSEYMDESAVNRLIGAPPGYVGYEGGGQLTDRVLEKPYSVVLLDEVEKAHPRILDLLLQILEEGRLTDGKGRTASFSETVIILTSNVGSQHLADPSLGPEEAAEMAREELRSHFRPEFLNRLDDIIFFHPLGQDDLRKILDLLLKKEEKLLAERSLQLEVTDGAREWLLAQNEHPEWGARPLRRIIQKNVREALADYLLRADPVPGTAVRVGVKKGALVFETDNP